MNPIFKYAVTAAAGLGIGTAVGYIIGKNIIEKQALASIDDLDNAWKDAYEKATKTGRYATAEGAASVLLPHVPLNYDPSEGDVDLGDGYYPGENGISEAELMDDEDKDLPPVDDAPITPPIIVDDTPNPELLAAVDAFNNRQSLNEAGVTWPGKQAPEGEYDDTPVSSVPEFKTVRDPNGPYLISIDEFMDDDVDSPFEKVEVYYFEGDNTLVDNKQQIIPDLNLVIGEKNLSRFGDGTTAIDQMYIRNERLEIDIEVTKDSDTYVHAVLGFNSEEENQRLMTKQAPKMREGDDN
jgi:hypothetical protein